MQVSARFDLDATSIYYFDERALKRVAKEGGPPSTLYSDPEHNPGHLVVDGDDVFFSSGPNFVLFSDAGPTESQVILRVPKAGGAPTMVTQLTSDPMRGESIDDLAIEGPYIVFSTSTAKEKGSLSFDTAFYSVPKTGGMPTKLTSGSQPNAALAVQGGTLYFGDHYDIKKVPVGGGAVADVSAHASDGVDAIALDESNVYWESGSCFFKTPR